MAHIFWALLTSSRSLGQLMLGAGVFFVLEEKKRNRERVLREKRVAGFSGQRDKISDCKRSDRWIVLKFSQLVHNT